MAQKKKETQEYVSVKVKGEAYDLLVAEKARTGVPIMTFLDKLITGALKPVGSASVRRKRGDASTAG